MATWRTTICCTLGPVNGAHLWCERSHSKMQKYVFNSTFFSVLLHVSFSFTCIKFDCVFVCLFIKKRSLQKKAFHSSFCSIEWKTWSRCANSRKKWSANSLRSKVCVHFIQAYTTNTTDLFIRFWPKSLGTINAVHADGLKFSHPLNHLGKSIADLPLLAIDSFRHMYLYPEFRAMRYV